MTDILITIDTNEGPPLAFDLMGTKNKISTVMASKIPGNATLTLRGMIDRREIDAVGTLEFVLHMASDVAVGRVSAWLYRKLKGRKATLHIDEHQIEIEEGEIKRIISRAIEEGK